MDDRMFDLPAPFVFAAALLAALFVAPSASVAQTSDTVGFAATNFEPVPSQHTGVLNLERPVVLGHLTPSAGLFFHYADDPVRIVSPDREQVRTRLVHDQLNLEAGFAIGLFDRVEVDLALPFVVHQGGGDLSGLGGTGTADGSTLSDIRASVRVALVRPETAGGFGASVSGVAYAPTGNPSKFTSDGKVRGAPRLALGWQSKNGYQIVGNAGMELAPAVSVRNYNRRQTLRWGLGGVAPLPVDRVDVLASVFGSNATSGGDVSEADPIEAMAAVRIDLPADLRLQVGGGAGLTDGVGAPGFRLFTSLHWASLRHDTDGDGLLDRNDDCPEDAEDTDGFEDADGCPDTDNDGDGIPDASDECPMTEGIEANDGCPERDRDKDGIRDGEDECPDKAEDRDDYEDADGCPDTDNDGDGIVDEQDDCPMVEGIEERNGCPSQDKDGDGIRDGEDKCPGDPEDKDGYRDEDGCPDRDNDGDGLPDTEDDCPDKPETRNGRKDEDGCPDESKAKVVEQKIEISEKVHFESNKAAIKSRSFGLLNDVVRVLENYDQVTKLRIEGHTDSRGTEQYNQALSRRRAESVKEFLVDQGIDRHRLTIEGRGESDPIATNDTETGRAENRRVEFIIVEVDGKPVDGGEVILEKETGGGEDAAGP